MEQKNISFNKGIHRTPSIGDSGELSECVNLIPRFGELQNIEPPKLLTGFTLSTGHELIYVHKKAGANSYTNYITKYNGGIYYNNTTPIDSITPLSVTSIGNTLCIATSNGTYYYLWESNKYLNLGNRIPDIELSFGLCGFGMCTPNDEYSNTVNPIEYPTGTATIFNLGGAILIKEGVLEDHVHSRINEIESKFQELGCFSYPFFVRYAIRLFDGSVTYQSSPILMLPNDDGLPIVIGDFGNSATYHKCTAYCYLAGAKLNCKLLSDTTILSRWKDIIKSVEIYISPQFQRYVENGKLLSPIIPYTTEDTGDDVVGYEHYKSYVKPIRALMADTWYNNSGQFHIGFKQLNKLTTNLTELCAANTTPDFVTLRTGQTINYDYDGDVRFAQGEIKLELKDEDVWWKSINENSEYYLAKEIKIGAELNGFSSRSFMDIKPETIKNIRTQTPLTEDTNHSRDVKAPSKLLSYNSRLFMSDYYRIISEPVNPNCFITNSYSAETSKLSIYVEYEFEGKKYYKKTEADSNIDLGHIHYFCYPDETVKKVALYDQTGNKGVILNMDGKVGSLSTYWFDEFKSAEVVNTGKSDFESLVLNSDVYTVNQSNRILISEADNPLMFKGSSALTLSSRIMNLTSTTKALSQGQFGQFPLYAFCEDGIWAIAINSDGTFESKQPVNRDVLLNDHCVCQLDDSVAYLTKEGMKIISGSQAECISTPLHGLNVDDTTGSSILSAAPSDYDGLIIPDKNAFHAHISEDNCLMLYDYPHRLIHLFTGTLNTSHNAHFVYSRDSQEWSMQKLHASYNNASTIIAKTVVPGYPLSYLQSGDDLYQYDHLNDVSNIRKGYFLTRPEALSNPFSRKCLYDLRLFGQKTLNSSKWKVVVLVSNDLQHWAKLTSLKGLSAKYYRFMVFTEFTDVDTLSGMALQYEERYGNKLR